ncbi:MAG: flagellar assembly protein FliH [Gammaproteobacteria bacterium]|nr:flagellar assembly protein FliH [Gammaproteobacteria bacterium]
MSSSKIFPGQGADVQQWRPPVMDDPDRPAPRIEEVSTPQSLPTAAELEAIQSEAYDEGYAKGREEGFSFGHKEGLSKSQQEMRHYAEQMEQLLAIFSEPLRELDNQVERELLSLVIAIVKQLVRREVKSDPNLIIGVVREALSILPVASQNVRLVVHPGDAELIREVYALGDTEIGWKLAEDPVISRGGCKVITETSQIDATLDSRLASLIAPLLAGARALDSEARQERD